MNPVWPSVVGILLFVTTACAPTLPQITRDPSNPIRTVAVLPLVNHTNDVEGPAYVRDLLRRSWASFTIW